jgi:hypothetical protein
MVHATSAMSVAAPSWRFKCGEQRRCREVELGTFELFGRDRLRVVRV